MMVVLFGSATSVVYSQASVGASNESQLRLGLISQNVEYCLSDKMQLNVLYSYENVGNMPVLLEKPRHYPVVWTYTVRDASTKEIVYEVKSSLFDMGAFRFDALPAKSDFEVIQKGGVYRIQDSFTLDLYDGTPDSSDYLRPGKYTFEVEISTWTFNPQLRAEYRDRMRASGYLWTKDLRSEPMPFTVLEKPRRTIEVCSLD